ncbi:cell division initiation protein, partial [Streptomyces sp. SID7982]|nr:cell division initiation protein [Streptomyces sp. SID7982]
AAYGYQEQPLQQGAQDAYGYQQQPDPYAAYQQQGGYDPNGYPPQPASQPDYGWQQQPQQHGQQHGQGQGHAPDQQGAGALDETSLFDTSMIDLEQLRRYEQGR